MRHLVARILGVTHRHFLRFFRARGEVLAGVSGDAVSQAIGFLGAVGGLYGLRLGPVIDVGDSAFRCLESVLSEIVDLFGVWKIRLASRWESRVSEPTRRTCRTASHGGRGQRDREGHHRGGQ